MNGTWSRVWSTALHSTFYEKAQPNINAAFSKSLWLFSVIPNKLCWQRWSGCDNRVIYTNAVLCTRYDLCTCIPVSFTSPYRVWNGWKCRKYKYKLHRSDKDCPELETRWHSILASCSVDLGLHVTTMHWQKSYHTKWNLCHVIVNDINSVIWLNIWFAE